MFATPSCDPPSPRPAGPSSDPPRFKRPISAQPRCIRGSGDDIVSSGVASDPSPKRQRGVFRAARARETGVGERVVRAAGSDLARAGQPVACALGSDCCGAGWDLARGSIVDDRPSTSDLLLSLCSCSCSCPWAVSAPRTSGRVAARAGLPRLLRESGYQIKGDEV